MEWHWIYWVIIAIAAFIIVGLERRQDRRHDELVEKINDLQDTIDRGFKIKSKGTIDTGSTSGDTDFCATKTVTDAMYGGGTGQSGKKYTHRVAVDPVADANVATEEMNLYWVNGRKSTGLGFRAETTVANSIQLPILTTTDP